MKPVVVTVASIALWSCALFALSSCALLSGRLPCAKDADCLSGDVCASDGLCAPGRSSSPSSTDSTNNVSGEGEGEGEGAGARVRHVSTTIGSIVDIGVELDDAFTLHVLPFGSAMCTTPADCTTSTGCDVSWSQLAVLITSDAAAGGLEQGVQSIGDATVGVLVETSAGFAGGDAELLGNATGAVTLPAGHHFTEVTYVDSGAPAHCSGTGSTDPRCHGSFANNCP